MDNSFPSVAGNSTLVGVEDSETQSLAGNSRRRVVRGWTAVGLLIGLSLAGYLGAFVIIDTFLKGSF